MGEENHYEFPLMGMDYDYSDAKVRAGGEENEIIISYQTSKQNNSGLHL